MRIVLDLESDGLLEAVTKIHCLCYYDLDLKKYISLTTYQQIKDLLATENLTIICHNVIRYDVPVLEKILSIKITARLIDTLALSWYLYPLRPKHGLEKWGEELGVAKPEIKDWSNLSLADYVHRCTEDVKINVLLYNKQMAYLGMLYEYDESKINSIINYLCYKMQCAREQEEIGCKIDVQLVNTSLEELNVMKQEKINTLIAAMPKNIKYKLVSKPKKCEKQDGSISSAGAKWYELLEEHNLPIDYTEDVRVKILEEDGNPASSSQLKDWLYSLGWEPINFEYRKSTKGEVNKVPQIYNDDSVCPSIRELYDMEPALESLDMLSLINHRIGIFESYLANIDERGYTKAEVNGFTNTLRFKHRKPIVNLPKISKFYGDKIRGAIISPSEDYVLCGSDMSSLEDTTKQHYMYFFDPEYVTQMRVPGFDPHLDIAVLARMLTEEQAEAHKLYSKTKGQEGENFSVIRGRAKTVNFAGVYGAGPPKIALTTGMTLDEARVLHTTYWNRNKSVKQVAKACKVKTLPVGPDEFQMWLHNPVSGFWYTLRYEKDRFSTLNQGTGVFIFDTWVREVRNRGIKIMLQYHDEIAFPLLRDEKDNVENKLRQAINAVNEKVKLNVPLDISVDFGDRYSDIH